MEELGVFEADQEAFAAKFQELRTKVEQHVQDEESLIFPQAERELEEQLEDLRDEMQEIKSNFSHSNCSHILCTMHAPPPRSLTYQQRGRRMEISLTASPRRGSLVHNKEYNSRGFSRRMHPAFSWNVMGIVERRAFYPSCSPMMDKTLFVGRPIAHSMECDMAAGLCIRPVPVDSHSAMWIRPVAISMENNAWNGAGLSSRRVRVYGCCSAAAEHKQARTTRGHR